MDNDNTIKKIEFHIRIQQRNGKKSITTLDGLNYITDNNKIIENIIKEMRKKFSCSVTYKKELNSLQMQGDHREGIKKFLIEYELAKPEDIKIHGF